MSEYRLWHVPGATYFFTVVTQDRAPMFLDPAAVKRLGVVMRTVRSKRPFRTIAAVLLPDHLHCIWSLPRGDSDFSGRWRWIKGAFTEHWLDEGGSETDPSASRVRKGERGIWQRRFWEHRIQDEDDLERHADYIHYNPVKHGLARRPADWPWSSFLRHVRLGQYAADWGRTEPTPPVTQPGE
ncbi:Transposase IS200 like protein [Aquisphaera giovannonii]|uniref:Transposase IS200 like protein n=1 Tax=Aquisphaera giovannonii TaxID=406548 RepID=A0A5B9W4H2_9BACT|nr:transposase [Aquisphaera giovannonii]QEH35109.1 Transposase IS200 like protein [Aquisphaera giovannonii]